MQRKWSKGRIISLTGTIMLCMGLFCNAFGLLSNTVFRIIVLMGIILQGIALFLTFKKGEF